MTTLFDKLIEHIDPDIYQLTPAEESFFALYNIVPIRIQQGGITARFAKDVGSGSLNSAPELILIFDRTIPIEKWITYVAASKWSPLPTR